MQLAGEVQILSAEELSEKTLVQKLTGSRMVTESDAKTTTRETKIAKGAMEKFKIEEEEKVLATLKEISTDSAPTDWAVLGYPEDGKTDTIKILASGTGALAEVKQFFKPEKVCYAILGYKFVETIDDVDCTCPFPPIPIQSISFHSISFRPLPFLFIPLPTLPSLPALLTGPIVCFVPLLDTRQKNAFLSWVGPSVKPLQKARSSQHRVPVYDYCLKALQLHCQIHAEKEEDLSEELIAEKLTGSRRQDQDKIKKETDRLKEKEATSRKGANVAAISPTDVAEIAVILKGVEESVNATLKSLRDDSNPINFIALGYEVRQHHHHLATRLAC